MSTIVLTDSQFREFMDAQRVHSLRANPPAIMTVEEAAIVSTLHLDTFRAKAAEGVLPCKKVGSRMLISWDALRECIRKGTR